MLREAYAAGATLLSLCSGSFVLGAAGLLDGRRCTTHWMYADRHADPRTPPPSWMPGRSTSTTANLITSAGTAAGIDACLHLVRRELGTAIATKIARRMVGRPSATAGSNSSWRCPFRRGARPTA